MLVRDVAAARSGYGPYVDPVSIDINSTGGLARALKGVQTVVLLGNVGRLVEASKTAGVQQLVLLSTAGWYCLLQLLQTPCVFSAVHGWQQVG